MKIMQLDRKLDLKVHTFEIKESNTGKVLLSETHRCTGLNVRRCDLTKYPHDAQLHIDGTSVGTIIKVFKEQS